MSERAGASEADREALARLRGASYGPAEAAQQTAPSQPEAGSPEPANPQETARSLPAAPAPGAGGRRRTVLGDLVGSLALVAVVAAGMLTAFAGQSPAGFPVEAQQPGTCHLALDPNELIAIPSDASPPVPCTSPHQTETTWVSEVTGVLAVPQVRPNGQLLNQILGGQCSDYVQLRQYLGADASDATGGIAAYIRFPTAAEWAEGKRTQVCQASARTDTPIGPTIDFPLAGVMRTAESVRFRLCRRSGAELTCDQPHTTEATSPNIVLPPGPWPGAVPALQRATAACLPVAEAYLEAPLASRPELIVLPDGPREAAWNVGNRSANCFIGYGDGRTTTTTLRGGLS